MSTLMVLLFTIVPGILFGVAFRQKLKRDDKIMDEENWKFIWNRDITRNISQFSRYDKTKEIYHNPASKIPRITFERFLNLYAVTPEKWIIETNEYNMNHNFPFYINEIKTTNKRGKEVIEEVAIPLYWTNPEELKKYYNWVEKTFEKGEGALFEKARNESLRQLTEYINEDLKEKRAQTEKELEAIENQFKEQFKEKKETVPQLTLDPPTKQYTSTTQNW